MMHWQNKFVYTHPLLGKDQSKGRIWLLKAQRQVLVIAWTPWWGSRYVVPVNAEQISLNMASSHQITQLLLVPQSNLLIVFCAGFTVKHGWNGSSVHAIGRTDSGCTKVEENTFCHQWTLQTWLHGGSFLLWLCGGLRTALCEHLSLRDVPCVSFHHLHRRSKNCSLVFWKGLIFRKREWVFFLSFQFWFVTDDAF